MDEEKGFFQGSERKEAFLDQKTSAQKTTNFCIFLKRLVHGFFSKNGDFLILSFYAKLIKKKCFLKVPKQKKPF